MGFPPYISIRALQTGILLKKNFILLKRNKWSTLVQILVPLLFVATLFAIDQALKSNEQVNEITGTVRESTEVPIPRIPLCTVGTALGNTKCYTLAWVNREKTDMGRSVFARILADNDIPLASTREFDTEDDLDDYLLANPNVTQANSSGIFSRGRMINVQESIATPMHVAAQRSILQNQSRDGLFDYEVSRMEYPHPAFASIDVVGSYGGLFFFASLMFNFVIQLGAIVTEKEVGLRRYLQLMGCRDSTYWASWFVINASMNLLSCLILIGAGVAFGLDFFMLNDFATYFVLFLLYSVAMVPMAFAISLALGRAKNALLVGFSLFLVGVLVQAIAAVAYEDGLDPVYPIIASLFPFVLLAKGLSDLASAVSADLSGEPGEGLRWADITTNDFFPLSSTFLWLAVDFAVYFALFYYLDNILPGAHGSRRKPWFLFTREYWMDEPPRLSAAERTHLRRTRSSGAMLGQQPAAGAAAAAPGTQGVLVRRPTQGVLDSEDEMVRKEREDIDNGTYPKNAAVVIQNVQKRFGFKLTEFWAIKGVSLSILPGQLFCLLGHNGAGKTTLINVLIGQYTPTAGYCEVVGHPIPDEMYAVRRKMGVCPQHDVLWGELTATEHVKLFAELKGVRGRAALDSEAKDRLADVQLTPIAGRESKSYSGGERRRLSVAIALTANPEVIYLDEPTTGMDPVSRRQVWGLIERIKRERVVVLTTHSMEEADILGDRIGIMTEGRLSVLGSSLLLKNKFGAGYTVSIEVNDPAALARVDAFVGQHLEGAVVQPRGQNWVPVQGQDGSLYHAQVAAAAGALPLSAGAAAAQAQVHAASVPGAVPLSPPAALPAQPAQPAVQPPPAQVAAAPVYIAAVHVTTGTYTVPRELNKRLAAFFEKLEQAKSELDIASYVVSMTTLDDVFMRLASMYEARAQAREMQRNAGRASAAGAQAAAAAPGPGQPAYVVARAEVHAAAPPVVAAGAAPSRGVGPAHAPPAAAFK